MDITILTATLAVVIATVGLLIYHYTTKSKKETPADNYSSDKTMPEGPDNEGPKEPMI